MFSLLSLSCICKKRTNLEINFRARRGDAKYINNRTDQESRENETCAQGRANLQQTHPRLTPARASEKK